MIQPKPDTKPLIERLEHAAEALEKDAAALRELVFHLGSPPGTLEAMVFRLYLQTGSTAATANALREAGIKTAEGRSFQQPHVSKILQTADKSSVGNDALWRLSTEQFSVKAKKTDQRWN